MWINDLEKHSKLIYIFTEYIEIIKCSYIKKLDNDLNKIDKTIFKQHFWRQNQQENFLQNFSKSLQEIMKIIINNEPQDFSSTYAKDFLHVSSKSISRYIFFNQSQVILICKILWLFNTNVKMARPSVFTDKNNRGCKNKSC